MKILQIVHGFPPESIAGTEQYCEAVSRHLLERGHECIVLAGSGRSAPQATLETVDKDGLLVTRYLPLEGRPRCWTEEYDPEAEGLVRHLLAAVRPDLVHLHHWLHLTNNLVAICADLGIPVVVTLHDAWTSCPRIHRVRGSGEFCPEPVATAPCLTCAERGPWQGDQEIADALMLRSGIVDRELAVAAAVIVPSEAHRVLIAQLCDLPTDRLIVLPNGRLQVYRTRQEGERERRGDMPRPLQIGHWGHLMYEKGSHLLLEAVHKLRDPSAVEVHLIGEASDPEYIARLRNLAQGIAVQLHGSYQPADLESFDLDLAVFPSIASESYSFTLEEALGLGLPVVVPNRGAFQERIGKAGLIFEAGQAEDLARVLQQIVDAPDLIETMRVSIRSEVPCAMETHLAMLEKIYKEVVRVDKQRAREVAPPSLKLLINMQQQVRAREATLKEREAALGALQGSLTRTEEAMKEREERLQQNHDLLQRDHDLLQQNHDLLQRDHETLADFVRHLRQTPLVRFQEWLLKLIGRS
jgi:glycosyltransferase involved in cell wall biosynthesis